MTFSEKIAVDDVRPPASPTSRSLAPPPRMNLASCPAELSFVSSSDPDPGLRRSTSGTKSLMPVNQVEVNEFIPDLGSDWIGCPSQDVAQGRATHTLDSVVTVSE